MKKFYECQVRCHVPHLFQVLSRISSGSHSGILPGIWHHSDILYGILSNIFKYSPTSSTFISCIQTSLSLVVLVFGRFAGFVWLGCWLMLVAVVLFDFLLHAFAVVCVVLLLAWLHVLTSHALPNADRCLTLFKV